MAAWVQRRFRTPQSALQTFAVTAAVIGAAGFVMIVGSVYASL